MCETQLCEVTYCLRVSKCAIKGAVCEKYILVKMRYDVHYIVGFFILYNHAKLGIVFL